MQQIPGTQGYERDTYTFIEISQKLDFFQICKDFVPFLPETKAAILDAGSGAGQNAAALSQLGHQVTAVEPMPEFLAAARAKYAEQNIQWLDGHLPELECLPAAACFDFILADGVFHHLTQKQQNSAIQRFSELLNPHGKMAISLRNGPPGAGICVYPTNANSIIEIAKQSALKCLFQSEMTPSLFRHKVGVTFQRLVLG